MDVNLKKLKRELATHRFNGSKAELRQTLHWAHASLEASERELAWQCLNARSSKSRDTKALCKQHADALLKLQEVAQLLRYVS
jgi:hypothetical protein